MAVAHLQFFRLCLYHLGETLENTARDAFRDHLEALCHILAKMKVSALIRPDPLSHG